MSAIVFTSLNYTGSPDSEDILGARRAVFLENQRRASLTPPLPPLPSGTGAELKASVLTIYSQHVTAIHLANIDSAKSQGGLQERFTNAELQQITTNLIARLNAGETAAAVVADTAA